jgi:AbrB family looped-hinge helix DNA binding protein
LLDLDMEQVTLAPDGQIAIPKDIRDALNLARGGTLTVELRGQEIVLSKEPAWKRLQGAAAGSDLIRAFAAYKRQKRERENPHSRFLGDRGEEHPPADVALTRIRTDEALVPSLWWFEVRYILPPVQR